MKLWFDGQCLQTASRRRGVGRYVYELLGAIAETCPSVELSISFNAAMGEAAIAAREEVRRWIPDRNIHLWHGVVRSGEMLSGYDGYRQLSEIALAHHIEQLDIDIALCTSPFEGAGDLAVPPPLRKDSRTPVAALFYDIIPFRFPDKYLTNRAAEAYYHRRIATLQDSALNLCISAFSERESLAVAPQTPTQNIMAGVSPEFLDIMKAPPVQVAGAPQCPFALYVGALDWRKNVTLIVDAFARLPEAQRTGCALVLAGDHPAPLMDELVQRWAELGLPPARLVRLGHVSDRELVALYRSARVVVQPSWMEGFGLSVLEAIVCNAPVIAANAGALPEVTGESDLLFDPSSADQLARLLTRLFTDDAFVRQMIDRQKGRAALFSWASSAKLAVQALEKLLAERPERTRRTVQEVRSDAAAQLKKIRAPKNGVAKTMALSEPEALGRRRLLIDATQTARIDHGTGIQRVVKLTTANLVDRPPEDPVDRLLVGCMDDTGWVELQGGGAEPLSFPDTRLRQIVQFGRNDTILMLDSSWEHWQRHQPTLMAARMRGAEVVTCLYDVVPVMMPAFTDIGMPEIFADWLQSALRSSSAFVCISRAVADELLALLKALDFPRPMKVGYWRLGADFAEAPPGVASPRGSANPNFLMVGTLEPRKGHAVALRAFERLWAQGSKASLTIVGKQGWGMEDFAAMLTNHPEFGRCLDWRESVDDDELASLYGQCNALIAASFAEGFGLPIVEAGRMNKPVIASDLAVFREVARGASNTRFFRVGDDADLAREVQAFISSPAPKPAGGATEAARWPGWAESAAELENVVLNGDWYQVYTPASHHAFTDPSDIGQREMMTPLPEADQRHTIEMLGGPTYDTRQKKLRYTVRVTNASRRSWSSAGLPDGRYGVNLSYFVLDGQGAVIGDDNPRSHVPLVLGAGQSCYMALDVPVSWRDKGGREIEFALVQEGVAWWRNGVKARLSVQSAGARALTRTPG